MVDMAYEEPQPLLSTELLLVALGVPRATAHPSQRPIPRLRRCAGPTTSGATTVATASLQPHPPSTELVSQGAHLSRQPSHPPQPQDTHRPAWG